MDKVVFATSFPPAENQTLVFKGALACSDHRFPTFEITATVLKARNLLNVFYCRLSAVEDLKSNIGAEQGQKMKATA